MKRVTMLFLSLVSATILCYSVIAQSSNYNKSLIHYWKFDEIQCMTFFNNVSHYHANAKIQTFPASGKISRCQYFSDSSAVNLANDSFFNWDSTASFTIEFWMLKDSSILDSMDYSNVILGRVDKKTKLKWWIGFDSVNRGKVVFSLFDSAGNGTTLISKKKLADSSWHHIAIIRNGYLHSTSLIIDGQRDTSIIYSYKKGFQSSSDINIGWLNYLDSCNYRGYLDELALYDDTLGMATIQDHYNNGNGKLYFKNDHMPEFKILPLGNSLTEGWTDGNLPDDKMIAYRYNLKNFLEGAGYKIDFIGSEQNGSFYFDDHQNAGISGTSDQYVLRLLKDGFDIRNNKQTIIPVRPYLEVYNPDIILLEVGTNDIASESAPWAEDTENFTAILNLIDDFEKQARKEITVIVGLVINRRLGNPYREKTSTFNINLKNLLNKRIFEGDNIIMVDLEHDAGFLYNDVDICSSDSAGVHPNETGYEKMAHLFADSIKTRLLADSSTPVFTTHPLTYLKETVYKYDAAAIGFPKPQYSLVKGPSGMTIDSVSGCIEWTPVANGSYPIEIKATNAIGSTFQNYVLEVTNIRIIRSDNCGTITARSGSPSSENPNLAFDNSTSTKWYNYQTSGITWIQYQFCSGAAYAINKYSITSANDVPSRDPFAWTLYGSNDGTNYTLLDTRSAISFTARYQTQEFSFTNSTAYQYYKFNFSPVSSDGLQLSEIELIETGSQVIKDTIPDSPSLLTASPVSYSEIDLSWIDNSNNETGFEIYRSTTSGSAFSLIYTTAANVTTYANQGLTATTTYYYKIKAVNSKGSSSFTSETSASTPAVSSSPIIRSDGCGTITARSGSPSSENPNLAFDNSVSTKWYNYQSSGITWIQYQFCYGAAYAIKKYSITSANDVPSRDPFAWTLYGSNDGTNYTLLDTRSAISFTARYQTQEFSFSNSTVYNYYKFNFSPASSDGLQLSEIELIESGSQVIKDTIPDSPSQLTASPVSFSEIDLSWIDNSNNETGFEIYRSTTSGSAFSLIYTTAANVTTYANQNLTATTTYYYKIKAVNSKGSSSFTSVTSASTPAVSSSPIIRSDGCGTITARSGSPSSENPNLAFDNSVSTKWYNYQSSGITWIQYQFCSGAAYAINKYSITSANDVPSRDPSAWTLYGSNDGTNYTLLDTRSAISFTARFQTQDFSFTNSTAYKYYKFNFSPVSSDGLQLSEIELIETGSQVIKDTIPDSPSQLTASPVSSSEIDLSWKDNSNNETGFEIYRSTTSGSAFSLIYTTAANVTTYANQGLTASTTYYYKIKAVNSKGSSSFTSETSASTPDASSLPIIRTDGCGTITARSGSPSSENPNLAFDNSVSTKWYNYQTSGITWIQYQFCSGAAYAINKYTLTSANDVPLRDPSTWTLHGSNDGTNYTLLDTRSAISFTARYQTQDFSFSNSTAYQYYKFNFSPVSSDGFQLSEIELIETFNTLKEAKGNNVILSDLLVYPNPFSEKLTINYYLEEDSYVQINVFDFTGKEIATIYKAFQMAGFQELNWNNEKGMSPGIYIVKITTNFYSKSVKIILK